MGKNKKDGMTINVNVNLSKENLNQDATAKISQLQPSRSAEKALTKKELELEVKKGSLVDVNDDDGGVIYARLVCRANGTNNYYSDTRNAEGRLVIGRKLENYTDD